MIDALTPPSTTTIDEAPRLAAQGGDQPVASAPVFNGFLDRARSEGMSEEELAGLLTPEAMMGVATVKV